MNMNNQMIELDKNKAVCPQYRQTSDRTHENSNNMRMSAHLDPLSVCLG